METKEKVLITAPGSREWILQSQPPGARLVMNNHTGNKETMLHWSTCHVLRQVAVPTPGAVVVLEDMPLRNGVGALSGLLAKALFEQEVAISPEKRTLGFCERCMVVETNKKVYV